MINRNLLKAKAIEKGFSMAAFINKTAEMLDLTPESIYRRLDGSIEFRQSEIKAVADVLGLSHADILAIFFD